MGIQDDIKDIDGLFNMVPVDHRITWDRVKEHIRALEKKAATKSLFGFTVGEEYPVWWETYDDRPSGEHRAKILDILPYTGELGFKAILKLSAPGTRRGHLHMCVE